MLNEKEEKILKPFMNYLYENSKMGKVFYRFQMDAETVCIVKYITDADSDNGLELEDPNYEEYYEFYFQIVKVEKKKKEEKIRKKQWIQVNYHNIPQKWEVVEESEI